MSGFIPAEYRQSWWGSFDPLLRRTLGLSGALGLAVLVSVMVAPVRLPALPDVEDMPERFARLILRESPPVRPPAAPAEVESPAPAMAEAVIPEAKAPPPREVAPVPTPKQAPVTPAPAREPAPQKSAERGATRAREQVTSSLAGVGASAGDALKGLSASLTTSKNRDAPPARRGGKRRGVSRGRDAGDLAQVEAVPGGGGVPAKTTGSLSGAGVGIETPRAIRSGDGGGAVGEDNGGTGGASGRSRASLLAVVRRYAAGIEYCYDNQLKREPSLRGKLTVSITVNPAGKVVGTRVISDTAGSVALRECVLGQIEEWRFPQATGPEVVFDAPFVFTPPR